LNDPNSSQDLIDALKAQLDDLRAAAALAAQQAEADKLAAEAAEALRLQQVAAELQAAQDEITRLLQEEADRVAAFNAAEAIRLAEEEAARVAAAAAAQALLDEAAAAAA